MIRRLVVIARRMAKLLAGTNPGRRRLRDGAQDGSFRRSRGAGARCRRDGKGPAGPGPDSGGLYSKSADAPTAIPARIADFPRGAAGGRSGGGDTRGRL